MQLEKNEQCPICEKKLKEPLFIDSRDATHINCSICGKYAMSAAFYEDHVEQDAKTVNRKKLGVFLEKHKNDQLRPFFSEMPIPVPDGYKNYPYQKCILSTRLDK